MSSILSPRQLLLAKALYAGHAPQASAEATVRTHSHDVIQGCEKKRKT